VPVSDVQVLQGNSVNDYTDVAICHIPGSNTVGIGQVTSDDAKRHRSRFYRTIAPTIVLLTFLAGAVIAPDVFIMKETDFNSFSRTAMTGPLLPSGFLLQTSLLLTSRRSRRFPGQDDKEQAARLPNSAS